VAGELRYRILASGRVYPQRRDVRVASRDMNPTAKMSTALLVRRSGSAKCRAACNAVRYLVPARASGWLFVAYLERGGGS